MDQAILQFNVTGLDVWVAEGAQLAWTGNRIRQADDHARRARKPWSDSAATSRSNSG